MLCSVFVNYFTNALQGIFFMMNKRSLSFEIVRLECCSRIFIHKNKTMRTQYLIPLKYYCLFFLFSFINNVAVGQHAGNAIYGTSNNSYYTKNSNYNSQIQNAKKFLISSKVLFLAPADRYVAVFGLIQEGKNIQECNGLIEKRLANFTQTLKGLGIKKEAIFIDAIAQGRIYSYALNEEENVAKETLKGFEIKKNIIISYTQNSLLDKIMTAAANEAIYDLIKVDYVVDKPDKIYEDLYKEALEVIETKELIYLELSEKEHFGYPEIIRFEKGRIQPIEAYRSYTAHESNEVSVEGYARYSNLKKVTARRIATHYFEAAPSDNFDKVINEHSLEPCVQFVLHLELRYEVF